MPPWLSYLFSVIPTGEPPPLRLAVEGSRQNPSTPQIDGISFRSVSFSSFVGARYIVPALKSVTPSASPPVISSGAGQSFLPFRSCERLACAERPLHHHARSLCVMKSLCRPFFSRLSSLFSFFLRTSRRLRKHPSHQLRLCICLIPRVVSHSRIFRVANFPAKFLHCRSHVP